MMVELGAVDRVTALSDDQAVAVLATVLDRRGLVVDPFAQEEQRAHLEEALSQPEIATQVEPEPGATSGDLARTALTHLIKTDPEVAALVDQAIGLASRMERDPTLIFAIGALVLMAFHADIELAKDPGKGWKFRFKTKGLSDSTIGKLLGQLMGNFLHPGA